MKEGERNVQSEVRYPHGRWREDPASSRRTNRDRLVPRLALPSANKVHSRRDPEGRTLGGIPPQHGPSRRFPAHAVVVRPQPQVWPLPGPHAARQPRALARRDNGATEKSCRDEKECAATH